MRVLLIEDDRATTRNIELMLKTDGITVEATDLGEDGIDFARTYEYDAILLDLTLPDMNGLEVLKALRRAKIATPVVILSGDAEVATKVRALSGGADDYIAKPFHKDEFVARLHAVIRRSAGHAESVIQVGEVCLNLDSKIVHVAGKRVHLTGKEYQMLELLALRRGKMLRKETFMSKLYGGADEPGAKIIDVFICKLRAKLALASNGRQHIETIWGGGYMLRDPNEAPARAAA